MTFGLSTAALVAFLAASLVLAATPGPGVVYIVARTLAQGRAAGLASVAGVAAGNLGNALAASLGLAALFAVSAAAFTVVKLAGAAYLVWLGIKALRKPVVAEPGTPAFVAPRPLKIAREGFVVALLNPKTALFFAAFLPQFMPHGAAPAGQAALLGAVFVAIAAVTDTGYVLASHWAAARLDRGHGAQRRGRWATAAVYVGLGLFTAVSGTRAAR